METAAQKQYKLDLESPLWQEKRLRVYERDEFTCTTCRINTDQLHPHHLTYEWGKKPWEYPLENFRTLCKFCHGIVTEFKLDVTTIDRIKRYKIDDDTTLFLMARNSYSILDIIIYRKWRNVYESFGTFEKVGLEKLMEFLKAFSRDAQ